MAMTSVFWVSREQAEVVVGCVAGVSRVEALEPLVDDIPVWPEQLVEEQGQALLVVRRELGDAGRDPERCCLAALRDPHPPGRDGGVDEESPEGCELTGPPLDVWTGPLAPHRIAQECRSHDVSDGLGVLRSGLPGER